MVEALKLNNGSTELDKNILDTMWEIETLCKRNTSGKRAIAALVEKCHNPGYTIDENSTKLLEDHHLLKNGRIQEWVINIALSAVVGSGDDMKIINPINFDGHPKRY